MLSQNQPGDWAGSLEIWLLEVAGQLVQAQRGANDSECHPGHRQEDGRRQSCLAGPEHEAALTHVQLVKLGGQVHLVPALRQQLALLPHHLRSLASAPLLR